MIPLLSICIPTYNRSKILEKTLRNILLTSHSEFEIVISNNASDDDTENIILSIKDSRIKYYKNNINMGGIYNMVRVLEVASGEYCFLLSDEDDIELMDVLRFIVSYKHLNPYVIKGNHFNFFSKELETSFRTFAFLRNFLSIF